jgi:hypothetical protein
MLLMFSFSSISQSKLNFDSLLKSTLSKYAAILENPNKYKLQVIYTQINRDADNKPAFKSYKFHSNKSYFYPASTVKLPVTLVALIKLNELKEKGLDLESPMLTDSAYYCQKKVFKDTTSQTKYPSLSGYIKKMWLVSDNWSCARVYEFIGCDYLHKQLEDNGFKNVRINNRLDAACPGDTAKTTPPVYFLNANNDTIYKQGLMMATYNKPHPIEKSLAGVKHRDANGKKRPGPKDFSKHNYFALSDVHEMMRKLVFNPYLKPEEQLPINDNHRLFVLKESGKMPKESEYPKYDKKEYYDSYKKYFMYGSAVATIDSGSIRVFNIVGRAYGFLIDCAYIVDFKNHLEFMLTASVFVNERRDIGSGKYEYEALGLPFLRDLSIGIYNYEKKRVKTNQPDLKEFNFFDYK